MRHKSTTIVQAETRAVISVSASHGGRTAANGGHPRGVRAEGMWPASAETSPAVIGSHGVPAERALRFDTDTRLFRLFNSNKN